MTDRGLTDLKSLCRTADMPLGNEALQDQKKVQVNPAEINLIHGLHV